MEDVLAEVRKAMAKVAALGPSPILASHSLLPTDSGIRFEFEGVHHFAAHPIMWEKIPANEVLSTSMRPAIERPLFGLPILNLDTNDDARRDFYGKFSKAMMATNAHA